VQQGNIKQVTLKKVVFHYRIILTRSWLSPLILRVLYFHPLPNLTTQQIPQRCKPILVMGPFSSRCLDLTGWLRKLAKL